MKFPSPLVRGTFIKREKRFFIHAQLDDGRLVTAHTNNTGRMSGCLTPGAVIWLSPAGNPARKLKWTLELIETVADTKEGIAGGVLVGVNTILANQLAAEAVTSGLIPELSVFPELHREVAYGSRGSRADFLLDGHPSLARCWVEVKNVTLVNHGHARFPDAPSQRARKHLLELAEMMAKGDQAALIFCIQRGDARTVGPADDIDPEYGRLLRQMVAKGLRTFAIRFQVNEISISPVDLAPWLMV